jgi:adenosylcobinamide kinase/adenosylcobinamide-phosphate guanylyltransferase
MGKMTFILGCSRSGKSFYAVDQAKKTKGKVCFIATCIPLDKEMKNRVAKHKDSRPLDWHLIEEEYDLAGAVKKAAKNFSVVIIDCLTIFVSNLVLKKLSQEEIEKKTLDMIMAVKSNSARVFIVSNEVGLGIVPGNRLSRDFRDIAGRVNQITAKQADKVYFMVSGIPWRIK